MGADDKFDFEGDMRIDPDQLDIAALEQANLAMHYSKELAQYERLVKKAHEKMKTIRSELTRDCNLEPDDYLGKGIKATAPNVEAYYRTHSDYIEAKAEWIEAEYDRDLVKAAADHIAFQRKNMITVLAQLLQNEYFAGPSIPRDLAKHWQKKQEAGRKEIISNSAPRRRRAE